MNTKLQCPECYEYTEHLRTKDVITCVSCGHTWDVSEPADPEGEPDENGIRDIIFENCHAEATDGCTVEPDGTCPHGYPSWLIQLGYM